MIPPLRVWRNITIFLVVVSTYVLVRFQGENAPYNRVVIYYQEKIKQFHQTGKDTVTVVLIGSSLALNAFGKTPDINVQCKPVKILRLNILGLDLDGIKGYGLLKTLADFPPNYLLFESNLLVSLSDSGDPSKSRMIFNSLFTKRNPLSLIRSDKKYIYPAIDRVLNELPVAHFSKQKDMTQTVLRSHRQYKITMQDLEVIDGPFKKLIQNACKIILVNYPVIQTPSLREIQNDFDKKVSEFQEKYEAPYWEVPQNYIKDEFFIDGAHMNESGSQVFVAWFSGRLNEELCNN